MITRVSNNYGFFIFLFIISGVKSEIIINIHAASLVDINPINFLFSIQKNVNPYDGEFVRVLKSTIDVLLK